MEEEEMEVDHEQEDEMEEEEMEVYHEQEDEVEDEVEPQEEEEK